MRERTDQPHWDSAARVLDTLLPHLPIAGRLQEYRVWEVWDEAVGQRVARKARPKKIQHGKLFVVVSNSAWMHELQFAKGLMKEQLNHRLGAPVVKDIFFVIGRVQEAVTRPPTPARRKVPSAGEPTVPTLGRPGIEAAFAALLAARRRRLSEQESHD